MKKVLITGEIVPFYDNWIEEEGFCNVKIVERQLNEANGEDIEVIINSYGGCVEEGFAIYTALRKYAKDNDANITTSAQGRCASIATAIFLAGDKRIINPYVEPFVHNAWTYAIGDAKEVQRIATDLQKCNEMIANHYAIHTELTKDEALALMEAETSISADECVAIRFATEKEEIFRPIALQNIISKPKTKNMSKNKNKSVWNKLKGFLKDEGILNKIVYTAEQNELDFYELEDDQAVSVGDKARYDGQDAEGEFKVPNPENPDEVMTYVFSAGELMEINETETEEEDTDEEMENLKTENEALKASLAEKDETISNLKEKNSSYKKAINKIKQFESEEEPKDEKKKKPSNKQTTDDKNKLSAAITNLKNKKQNGL